MYMKQFHQRRAAIALAALVFISGVAVAQDKSQPASAPSTTAQDKQSRPRKAADDANTQASKPAANAPAGTTGAGLGAGDAAAPRRADIPEATIANRREGVGEDEAGVVPYYNNFLSTYRLGPEDVISITVFGLDRYSRAGILVPPDGIVSHQLIPEGILVAGKTTRQVQAEITKKLDEYVTDPKVTVSLDKAQSAVYSVIGDVGQPGVRVMARRLSVTEALALSGGVLSTGDKKKVVIMRRQADGFLMQVPVNVAAIEKGKLPDNEFLRAGDQVVVPGNRLKTVKAILGYLPILSFARIFTGGF